MAEPLLDEPLPADAAVGLSYATEHRPTSRSPYYRLQVVRSARRARAPFLQGSGRGATAREALSGMPSARRSSGAHLVVERVVGGAHIGPLRLATTVRHLECRQDLHFG